MLLMSAVLLLVPLTELSGDDQSDACVSSHLKDVYYWENWLDTGPRNSNNGQHVQCRSRVFVDRLYMGKSSTTKLAKSAIKKIPKTFKGSKIKRKKEKRKKQARLKKERLDKKKNGRSSKRKHIKDTYD